MYRDSFFESSVHDYKLLLHLKKIVSGIEFMNIVNKIQIYTIQYILLKQSPRMRSSEYRNRQLMSNIDIFYLSDSLHQYQKYKIISFALIHQYGNFPESRLLR